MPSKILLSLCLAAGLSLSASPAAKAETLKFYSSITTEPQKAMVDAIEKKFPGVKIDWVRGGGIGIFQRFVSEKMAGQGDLDLIHFSYPPGFYYLRDQGWLKEGIAESAAVKDFPKWAIGEKGDFVALRVPTLQVVYNSDKVSDDEVPTSWAELLTDKWRGRIVAPNPFESAGVWDFFYASPEFGPDYIKGLFDNDILIQRQMGSSLDAVARGERDISFIFEYIALTRMDDAPNLKFAKMKEGLPVIPAPIAILADADHPELAQKVFDYMLSKEGQEIMSREVGTYSARPDVPPPAGLEPLSKQKLLFADFGKVFRDQDEYRDMMNRYLRRAR